MEIRKCRAPRKELAPVLAEIDRICFSAKGEHWAAPSVAWEIAHHDLWLIRDNGKIIGFLIAEDRKGRGYISTVDILPKYRGRGLATRLMVLAERAYRRRGYRWMRLHVESNNPAQTLYFKLGYRVVAHLQDYYRRGSHGLTMEKRL